MQVRLPEDDEEDNLVQSDSNAEALSARQEQENGGAVNDSLLKYLIAAGLVLVLVILLTSSHQKIRIVYNEQKEGRVNKQTISPAKNTLQQHSVKENTEKQEKERKTK